MLFVPLLLPPIANSECETSIFAYGTQHIFWPVVEKQATVNIGLLYVQYTEEMQRDKMVYIK